MSSEAVYRAKRKRRHDFKGSTMEIIKAVPAQPQRWWVDHMHAVQSGRLVDTQTGKAVLSDHRGFHIIDIDQLKTNYVEACQEALTRLGKSQTDINNRFVSLMAEMAKQANVK